MKFMVAKNDNIKCSGCTATIQRGDEMVLTFIRTNNYKKTLNYHTVCYIPWYTDMFNRKWSIWHDTAGTTKNPRCHRGRPIKIKEPSQRIQLNRLMANRTYHAKRGHTVAVERMNKAIERIKSTH